MALNKANTYDKDDLVVGRGRLYFNRRRNGVYLGERYLGNTTELSLSSSVDKLDHYSSDHGFKNKDKTVNIENSRSGSFTTDIISHDNIALWFGGDRQNTVFSAQNDVVEVVNGGAPVTKGYIYQLGVSDAAPQGQGGIDGTTFTIGYADANTSISAGTGDISTIPGVTVLNDSNYELDADRGRLYIESDAPDITGEVKLVVKYNRKASSGTVIISSDEIIEGSLRFESDNPTGNQKNYFIPLITISADGDYALKGDDWQALGFTFDVLKKDALTAPITIYDNPVIGSGSTSGSGTGNGGGTGTGGGNTTPARTYTVSEVTIVAKTDGKIKAGDSTAVQAKVVDQDGNTAPDGITVYLNVQNGELTSAQINTASGTGVASTVVKAGSVGNMSVGAATKSGETQQRAVMEVIA